MHRIAARKEILPDKGSFVSCKNTGQGERSISRSEIKKIIESHGRWYQNIRFSFMLETRHTTRDLGGKIRAECRLTAKKWLRMKTKEEVLITSLPDLTGKRVIDVGCNSGLYSVEASCRGADFVLGIDINYRAIMQARDVTEIFRRLSRPIGNIEFRVADITNNLAIIDDMDVLIACCVLYHLGPLHRFKKRITQSKIHRLILQGNTHRLTKIGQYNNPSSEFYEPENKTWGNILCDVKGMTDFCHSMDFKVEKVVLPTHQYPVVIAVRG